LKLWFSSKHLFYYPATIPLHFLKAQALYPIGQAELLARFAVLQGAGRLSLLTSTSLSGQTFLSWFGFFARDLGYAADAVRIDALDAVAGEGRPRDGGHEAALIAVPTLWLSPHS